MGVWFGIDRGIVRAPPLHSMDIARASTSYISLFRLMFDAVENLLKILNTNLI